MRNKVYVTVYTREGKQELTRDEWYDFDASKLHREGDLPAVEFSDGPKYWCKDAKRHRETGPALIGLNGLVIYYLSGKHYSEENFHKKLREVDELPLSLTLTHEEEWIRERAKRRTE